MQKTFELITGKKRFILGCKLILLIHLNESLKTKEPHITPVNSCPSLRQFFSLSCNLWEIEMFCSDFKWLHEMITCDINVFECLHWLACNEKKIRKEFCWFKHSALIPSWRCLVEMLSCNDVSTVSYIKHDFIIILKCFNFMAHSKQYRLL